MHRKGHLPCFDYLYPISEEVEWQPGAASAGALEQPVDAHAVLLLPSLFAALCIRFLSYRYMCWSQCLCHPTAAGNEHGPTTLDLISKHFRIR